MNRSDFQILAEVRIREAKALLKAGHASGAYYLAGYAVECALKAKIARNIKRYEFPDRQAVNNNHTHNLSNLLKLAGLDIQLRDDSLASPKLEVAWAVVKDWSAESRYREVSLPEARDLVGAVGTRVNGVLPWIKRSWQPIVSKRVQFFSSDSTSFGFPSVMLSGYECWMRTTGGCG